MAKLSKKSWHVSDVQGSLGVDEEAMCACLEIFDEEGSLLDWRTITPYAAGLARRSLRGSGYVYRVENTDTRVGPFRTIPDFSWNLEEATPALEFFWATRRTPSEDDLPIWEDYVCGTPDLEGVFHWFGGVLALLKQFGFVVRKYWTECHFEGSLHNQVTFKASTAVLVDEIPL